MERNHLAYKVFDPDLVGNSSPERIRNVCVLAHVDHGKTTLSDHLISSNGLISQRSAGQLRFLDSREDEQRRLITMKASCITLSFIPEVDSQPYWINLIDSPGHVDFSTEVSAATRLSDGALILIDAIEGVCPQTRQVILRAFAERTKLLLVINKMDRLFTELCLSPSEVYSHLCTILEQVNVTTQQLLVEEAMRSSVTKAPETDEDINTQHFEIDDEVEAEVQFSPEKRHSKTDSSIVGRLLFEPKDQSHFKKASQKRKQSDDHPIGFRSAVEGETLTKWNNGIRLSVLQVYNCTVHNFDRTSVNKILHGLNLSGAIRDASSLKDSNSAIRAIMSAWLPLSTNLLKAIVDKLPSPVESSEHRLVQLLPGFKTYVQGIDAKIDNSSTRKENSEANPERLRVYDSLRKCGTNPDDRIVIYAAKFLGADLRNLRLTGDKLSGNERLSDFVTISRVLSGTVSVGTTLYVCGTEFVQQRCLSSSSEESTTQTSTVIVSRMFYLLGQDLVETKMVRAGAVVALCLQRPSVDDGSTDSHQIDDVLAWVMSLRDPHAKRQALNRGVELRTDRTLSSIDRCITLSDSPFCPPLKTPYSEVSSGWTIPAYQKPFSCQISSAIVRVCLEPKDLQDTTAMLRGLATLYKADPGVEVDVLDSGEVTLGCSGEVHLDKCINDLQNLYAQVEINVSAPVVAVRESLSFAQPSLPTQSISTAVPFPPWASVVSEKLGGIEEDPNTVHTCEESDVPNPASDSHYDGGLKHSFPSIGASLQMESDKSNVVVGVTPNNVYAFRMRAEPLPGAVLEWLDQNAAELQLRLSQHDHHLKDPSLYGSQGDMDFADLDSLDQDIANLWEHSWDSDQEPSVDQEHSISSNRLLRAPKDSLSVFSGSRRSPGRLLGVAVSRGSRNLFFWSVESGQKLPDDHFSEIPSSLRRLLPSMITGFELASQSGPFCEEPVVGVAFCIEAFTNQGGIVDGGAVNSSIGDSPSAKDDKATTVASQPYGPVSGQVISCIKDCCRRSLMQRGRVRIYEAVQRLGEASFCHALVLFLFVELHCEQEVLGRAYGVLSKRRAQIVSEALREGTSLFAVEAFLPIIESFGLALELRSRASGQVSLHVQFSHWQMIEEDPFPEALMSEEVSELEDEGESGFLSFPSNISRKIIYTIRKRKGLPTDEKVVATATKQRTLTRNK
ncbi:elongation factor-like GTPase 1 [Condylostylus longicornis]|uniref:elongation factor-like GTPase 1 n=1 Tax=Condylostylus longicornis TaxID=2530218 RepID=UPI00244E071B|nr:elongation factor-like GTPase 1 [Condylostylus longicornis]